MSTFLRSISKGASNLVWGSNEDEKHPNTNTNTNNKNSNNNDSNDKNDSFAFGSAKGELWRYSEKNENFKLVLRNVEVKIMEPTKNDEFLCSFEIYKPNGDLLLREPLTNDLQFQYNKNDHSMLFSILTEKDKLSVLQFIFSSLHDENDLKWRIGIKLMEYNRQESFDHMIKSNELTMDDKDYVCNAFENEPENEDYIETEDDWRDLDTDVVMRDFAKLTIDNDNNYTNDLNDNDNENDANYDEKYDAVREEQDNEQEQSQEQDIDELDDEDYDAPRGNKWEQAASKPVVNNLSEVDGVNSFEDDLHQSGMKNKNTQINRYITNAKAFNRSYVIRETKPGKSVLGYFKHNNDNELVYKGKIGLQDVNGNDFTPSKAMQFKSDTNMLLLSKQKPGIISVLNVDRGKVIEEWEGQELELGGTNDIAPLTKFDELTDNTQLYGINKQSMFLMDGRINKKQKIVDSKTQIYKSKTGMSTIATTGQGFIATGSEAGQIRLYDKVEKRAKTLLPGLGAAIKHIEASNDGKWLLCTCKEYIMLIPTVVPGTDRLGFTGRGMGKLKPKPYVLKLKPNDIAKYSIINVDFTPAHFDISNESTFAEHWIVASTGPYILKWNFNKLKKSGIVNSYSIRRAKTKVMHNTFRFNFGDDLLVSEMDNVYAQHSKASK